MTDSRPTSADDGDDSGSGNDDAETPEPAGAGVEPVDGESETAEGPVSEAELRRRVEEKYDFENFGPADMAEMTADEWDAAFDADSWITGEELLDRVETDLERRVANRDVFAVIERRTVDGKAAVLAYSDEGYALVHGDGSIEGFGTALRDVKPTVALCSMESYEPEEAPASAVLPRPDEVPEGSGELGNLMLQVIAAVLGIAGVVLLGSAVVAPGSAAGDAIGRGLMIVFGLLFLAATIVLFVTVANARLSDKFRAEEYRNRLRSVGLEDGERPDFLPFEDDDPIDSTLERTTDEDGQTAADDSQTIPEESPAGGEDGRPAAEGSQIEGRDEDRGELDGDADIGDEDGSNPTT